MKTSLEIAKKIRSLQQLVFWKKCTFWKNFEFLCVSFRALSGHGRETGAPSPNRKRCADAKSSEWKLLSLRGHTGCPDRYNSYTNNYFCLIFFGGHLLRSLVSKNIKKFVFIAIEVFKKDPKRHKVVIMMLKFFNLNQRKST